MANGKPGDHPFTDIVVHGRDVYSPRIAGLVREIAGLADEQSRKALADLLYFQFNEISDPDLGALERALMEMRDALTGTAGDGG